MNKLQKLMGRASFGKMGLACDVSKTAVQSWYNKGRLPHTEHLPQDHPERTNHAEKLAMILECNPQDLLEYQHK